MISKSIQSSSLIEAIDHLLDKGIVIDIYACASILGVNLISIDSRVVIACVDTWLNYAKEIGLIKQETPPPPSPPEKPFVFVSISPIIIKWNHV
jgi:gas vesicle structural protein